MPETPALRERCRNWLDKRQMNAIMRVGNDVDDLVAFVIAERGKTADPVLDGALPLCLSAAPQPPSERVAQRSEQAAHNGTVAGSTPAAFTTSEGDINQ